MGAFPLGAGGVMRMNGECSSEVSGFNDALD
jgi:hypothetical protein